MTAVESLRLNLTKAFDLPPDAVEWLVAMWGVAQFFDDVADGDQIQKSDLDAVMFDLLVGQSQNGFWRRHVDHLTPLVSVCLLKWHGANTAEKTGKHNAMSFAWRAGFYDLILAVVSLVHGHHAASRVAHVVMQLYGESFEEYLKEFSNA